MTRVAITLLVTLLVAACKPASGPAAKPTPSANAWAVVNGKEITKDDVDKAYRRAAPDGVLPAHPPHDGGFAPRAPTGAAPQAPLVYG